MSLADSPFVSRLHTNYVPLDSEILGIRSLLVDATHEMARIDTQIEAMEIALGQLKKHRASLKLQINAHLALISPIRRVPQDVLLEIFQPCLPTEHNALIDYAEAPLLLGRICRHWRAIAHSTPMLWSSIHIPSLDYHNTPPNILSRFEGIVKAWLERSGSCPLSVSLHDPSFYGTFADHPLILELLSISRRLRHLELTGHAWLFHPLLRLGSEDMPLLKRLWLKSTEDYPEVITAFHIPTLEDVVLRGHMPWDPPTLPFQWAQLTRLSLECFPVWMQHDSRKGGLDFRGIFDMLERCHNLVYCEIRATKSLESDAPLDMPPIILPYLETLVFNQCGFRNWSLDAPSLRFLSIGDACPRPSGRPGFLAANIDPHRFISPDGFRDLLQSFPTITHLRLSSVTGPISLEDLELFCPPHGLCPKLTHFTTLSPADTFSDAAVLAFVKARMAMPTPLQELHLSFDRPIEVDLMPELEPFFPGGLQVTLDYQSSRWNFDARHGLHEY
ncbi:hypothetical protein C8R45DRAFT_440055 [Mycena sanguinolenta]|nr:hypothetical protein C8R45DRAFT_440055 [Mycena sanguinolenta]